LTAATVHLKEHGPPVDVDPTLRVDRLVGSRSVEVVARPGGGVALKARNIVGVLCCGDTQVYIEPKVEVGRLLFLLGYARNPEGWLDDQVDLDREDDLVPAVARAFVAATGRALAAGLLKGYQPVETVMPALRGRLDEARQMTVGRGLALPVAVRFDDYTPDVTENRILVSATRRLLRLAGLPTRTVGALRQLDNALLGINPLRPGRPPVVRWDRRNRRYRSAVVLAQLILAGSSLEARVGAVTGTAFAFDMNAVFEDFLSAALARSLAWHGGRTARQVTTVTLDHQGRVDLRPDLVWDSPVGPVIIDAKYKSDSAPNGDVYQVLSYCTAFGATAGHIVDASGGELQGRELSVRRSPIRI
jgi:5-methylcytosine-specific restriction enzyme subunit McrC